MSKIASRSIAVSAPNGGLNNATELDLMIDGSAYGFTKGSNPPWYTLTWSDNEVRIENWDYFDDKSLSAIRFYAYPVGDIFGGWQPVSPPIVMGAPPMPVFSTTLAAVRSDTPNEVTIEGTGFDAVSAIELGDDQNMSMGSGWNPNHPQAAQIADPNAQWYVEVLAWTNTNVRLRKASTGGYGAWGGQVMTLVRTNDWALSQNRDYTSPGAFAAITVQRPAGQVFVRRAYAPAPNQLVIEGDGLLDLNWMQARSGQMSQIGDSWTTPGVDASQQNRAFKHYNGDPRLVLLSHAYLSGTSIDNVFLNTFTGLPAGGQAFQLYPPVYVP